MRRYLILGAGAALALAVAAPQHARAAGNLSVHDLNHGVTATDLANSLVGTGVVISNVTYTGASNAAGAFSGGTSIGGASGFGFDSGVVLSTGSAQGTGAADHGVSGPNDNSAYTVTNGTAGDTDLNSLVAPALTFDAAVLEFDFVPNQDKINFTYVFGSEEYNEFVNSSFDDVFGFFIDGHDFAHDCATVPGPSGPERVSVNTVNDGNSLPSVPPAGPGMNANLFVNNDFQSPAATAPYNTQLDGFTVPLSCVASVVPNQPNHLKLAIADTADTVLDSDVFIQAGSLSAGLPPGVPEAPLTAALGLAGIAVIAAILPGGPIRARRRRRAVAARP